MKMTTLILACYMCLVLTIGLNSYYIEKKQDKVIQRIDSLISTRLMDSVSVKCNHCGSTSKTFIYGYK